ncbi:MAG: hypothetical protein ACE5R4_14985 [Armatimonadota bacterium]
MNGYRMTRVVRSLTSEVYLIWEGSRRVGQVDVHYAQDIIHATMVLEPDVHTEVEALLIRQLDRDVVSSHLEDYRRDDFLVTVYRGNETTSYSDPIPESGPELPNLDWE